MTYFLDFDRTLFDTDAFITHLLSRPQANQFYKKSKNQLELTIKDISNIGASAFDSNELIQFVYPEVLQFLRMVGSEAVIITYGNPTWQKLKIENIFMKTPRISVIYTDDKRKGEVVTDKISQYNKPIIFIDDKISELENMEKYCPQVQLFEMRRDGGVGDGRWQVIHSLLDLP